MTTFTIPTRGQGLYEFTRDVQGWLAGQVAEDGLLTLFPEGTDMGAATDRVDELVNSVRNLPSEAETPEVTSTVRYEPIARLLVGGAADIRELRPLVRKIERELLERVIAKVNITGLPEDELAIQLPQATLDDLGLSLQQVANRIAAESRDVPAGTVVDTSRGGKITLDKP